MTSAPPGRADGAGSSQRDGNESAVVTPSADHAGAPNRSLPLLVSAGLLIVGAPAVFVDWTRNAGSTTNVLLALALLTFSGARLAGIIAMRRIEILRSLFYVFVFVFLAVPALAQTVAAAFPLDGLTYSPATITTGLLHLLVGVAGYEIGWMLRRERRTDSDSYQPSAPRPSWLTFSRARCVAIAAVGLGATLYQVSSYGIATFFASRSETTAALTGGDSAQPFYQSENKTSGLVTIFLSQFLVFVALFAILYARRHGLWPRISLVQDSLWRLLVLALVAANIVMNNPMGNGRWWFCLVGIAFASVYLPYDRAGSQRVYVVGAIVILLFSFASLDLYRFNSSSLEVAGPQETIVSNETYAMFQMELNGVNFVDRNGHTDGQQLIGSFFGFVPRAFWDDKPIPTGQLVDPQYLRSATAWTEAQVDFGPLGVLGFFVVYGALSRALTDRSRQVELGMMHATVPVLAALQIFLLRGSLQPALGSLDQLVLAFAVVATRTGPARRPGTDPRGPAVGEAARTAGAASIHAAEAERWS